jgi:hypothetical protein
MSMMTCEMSGCTGTAIDQATNYELTDTEKAPAVPARAAAIKSWVFIVGFDPSALLVSSVGLF